MVLGVSVLLWLMPFLEIERSPLSSEPPSQSCALTDDRTSSDTHPRTLNPRPYVFILHTNTMRLSLEADTSHLYMVYSLLWVVQDLYHQPHYSQRGLT